MTIVFVALIVIAALVLLLAGSGVRVITQFERGVVLRFGQLRDATRGPGLTLIAPIVDRLHKVNMQIVTMPVPAQEAVTRDNVTVRVDAVVCYRVELLRFLERATPPVIATAVSSEAADRAAVPEAATHGHFMRANGVDPAGSDSVPVTGGAAPTGRPTGELVSRPTATSSISVVADR